MAQPFPFLFTLTVWFMKCRTEKRSALLTFLLELCKKTWYKQSRSYPTIETRGDNNERNFEGIMLHFFTFNNWDNDMSYFLELVKKDEFDYFINSNNNELLYQAIGYLVYSYYQKLNMRDKLDLIYSTYHYFIANKN